MAKTPNTNPVLDPLTALALALPEARRELSGSHASFRVRKKTFAYFLNNHHGDGIVAVTCKVLPGENAALAKAQPKRYYLPAYILTIPAVFYFFVFSMDQLDPTKLRETGWIFNGPEAGG